MPNKRSLCTVCPKNKKVLDGSRATGDSNCNTYHHMANKDHFGCYRQWALNLPFDEEAYAQFVLGCSVHSYVLRRVAPSRPLGSGSPPALPQMPQL